MSLAFFSWEVIITMVSGVKSTRSGAALKYAPKELAVPSAFSSTSLGML